MLAAVLMIEVIGLGGPRLTLVLLPGPAGRGHRLAGLGRHGLVDRAEHERLCPGLGGRSRASFARPDIADFGWTIALALAVALGCVLIVGGARRIVGIVAVRRFVLLPAAGLIVAALAIVFQQVSGKPFQEVLFSGQASIPGLAGKAGTWSIGALALLVDLQGHRLLDLARQLPRRPDLPRDVPGSGGGADGRTAARLSRSHRPSLWAWPPRSRPCCACRCRRS